MRLSNENRQLETSGLDPLVAGRAHSTITYLRDGNIKSAANGTISRRSTPPNHYESLIIYSEDELVKPSFLRKTSCWRPRHGVRIIIILLT